MYRSAVLFSAAVKTQLSGLYAREDPVMQRAGAYGDRHDPGTTGHGSASAYLLCVRAGGH